MKRFFLFAAAVAMVLVSCNKLDNPSKEQSSSSERAIVRLNLGSMATKADPLQTSDEAKVSSIQIFVFNGNDVDAYKAAESSEITAMSVTVQATAGTRDIYAFVNAPDLSAYVSKSALLAAASNLSDNSADHFVMQGKLENQTVGAEYSQTIYVDRYASRIRISKITRQMAAVGMRAVNFRITKMYLTSAVTNELYNFGQPSSYSWINQSFGSSRALATGNAFVYQSLSTPASVADGASYSTPHSFYAYSNVNTEDDTDNPKTFRRTRLVVECQIDADGNGTFDADEYYTYPIALGALEANKSYEIRELVITMLGNNSNGDNNADDGEDDDITKVQATVSIIVNDWSQVLIGDNGVFTI